MGFFMRSYPHLYRPTEECCDCYNIIEDSGRIASHVGLYPLHLLISGCEFTIGGIGGVATLPAARGKGYMSELLHHVIAEMRAREIGASGLGGDRQRYGPFGWDLAGQTCRFQFSRRSLARAGIKTTAMAEAAPEDAVGAVSAAQASSAATARRTDLVHQLGKQGTRVFVGPSGYAIIRGEKRRTVEILELVSLASDEAPMVQALLDVVYAENANWRVPLFDAERVARMSECASNWAVENDWSYRIVDLGVALNAYKALLPKMLYDTRSFEASLTLVEDDRRQTVLVSWDGESLEMLAGRHAKDGVEMGPCDAARFIFGGTPPGQAGAIPVGIRRMFPLPIHVPELDSV